MLIINLEEVQFADEDGLPWENGDTKIEKKGKRLFRFSAYTGDIYGQKKF